MKRLLLSILVIGAAGGLCPAATSDEVQVGDTYQQMVDKIGRPQGTVAGKSRMTCYYERGTVDLVAGRVTRAFLVSEVEGRARTLAREKEETAQRQRAEAERARLAETGRGEKDRMVSDKLFAQRPPKERLDYWTRFAKQYPYTDVSLQIAEAQKAAEVGQVERKRADRLAELNKRVDEIQARFVQLDEDYANSLANWKRTEINSERARLKDELASIATRIKDLSK